MSTFDHATVPITVLLPVHNGGEHLVAAIASILTQSHRAYELLVIDDGSNDGTAQFLDQITDPRLRVLTRNRQGLVAALNWGLSEARHDVIARMDADDVSHPRRLELQLEHLLRHPEVAAVGCCYDVVDDDGRPLTRVHTAGEPGYIHRQLFFRNVLPHAGMMYRRDAVVSAGGYRDVGPAEDYDLWMRLSSAHDIASLPQVLLTYRRSPGGISATAAGLQRAAHRHIRDARLGGETFPPTSARQTLREGLRHADIYGRSCPECLRTYVFDHIWLALLLLARRSTRAGMALALGAVALAALRPRSAAGIFDAARDAAGSRRRAVTRAAPVER
jgi:glycosyltransferase involved in cell wall biosynthesis